MNKFNWGMKACSIFLLWTGAAVALPAQTTASAPPSAKFTTLHRFTGTDGIFPEAGLVQATNGDFYGTTAGGGTNNSCYEGCGTVFKITPSGKLTTLYSFCSEGGRHCTDGESPQAGLVQAIDGNFYGTTVGGGANDDCGTGGCGTVFKITPSGSLTTIYSFCSQSNCTDGSSPEADLVQGTDRNLYGTAELGGANGGGTVFKISPSGTLTIIYSFCSQSNCTDGDDPIAGLVQATDGNFYGTTAEGGAHAGSGDAYGGTVFKITPGGVLTTLYSFCAQSNCTDGDFPEAGLVQAANGNFYGTTAYGGAFLCYDSCGTVFKITPSGTLTTLHSFDGTDGSQSVAGLVQASDGRFYGTTEFGGANGEGAVFRITPGGTLTTLHSFDGVNGAIPEAGLIQATSGKFYGTAATGNGYGTIFTLSVGQK
jgi:uncharacterized repeat protein (TIGR03803 family)